MSIAAVILAAGASRRLGQPKQLLPHAGEALLQRALRLVRESGSEPILVVLGAEFARICVAIPFDDAIPVFNDRWEDGMASSIHAGLNELDVRAPESKGALVMGCDQPHLSSAHLRSLLKAFNEHKSSAIVASSYAGVRGMPAVFPRTVFPALHQIQGDKGARGLLANPPILIAEVEFVGGEVDIDIPDDLSHLQ